MTIKNKLTLWFTCIVAFIILLFSFSIYYISQEYRESEFNARLKEKALTTARLLIKIQKVNQDLLNILSDNGNKLVNEKVVIYNYLNEQMYNSVEGDTFIISKDLLDQIRLEEEVYFTKNGEEVIGLLYSDRYNRFVVIASAYDKFGFSKLKILKITLITGVILSILIIIVSGSLYSEQALKPISDVIRQVNNITASNLDSRVDEGNGNDEIAKLAITFNNMLERINNAFNIQKSFVSNASHELRTPLTAITGQIEVTLMKQRDTEEYKNILNLILEDIKNLNQLSNGLLELVQASTDASVVPFKSIRIDELFWQTRTELLKRKEEYNININFEDLPEEENKLILWGNEQLLKTAIGNLMENACKFSNDRQVDVNIGFDEENILLSFKDKGIGISKDELHHIFEPFFRASNAKTIKGHGIGLSLAKKIIEMHKGNISITSKIGEGTTSFVKIPHSKHQIV
jgi:signal transduction histidine kinase